MKGIRIEQVNVDGHPTHYLFDVVCDCGASNGLLDEDTKTRSFHHVVRATNEGEREKKLSCPGCGKKHVIRSQGAHFHVFSA